MKHGLISDWQRGKVERIKENRDKVNWCKTQRVSRDLALEEKRNTIM